MGLARHNKRFLSLATSRLLIHCFLFRTICNGGGIPSKSVSLGNAGEIPLITIGNSVFP